MGCEALRDSSLFILKYCCAKGRVWGWTNISVILIGGGGNHLHNCYWGDIDLKFLFIRMGGPCGHKTKYKEQIQITFFLLTSLANYDKVTEMLHI